MEDRRRSYEDELDFYVPWRPRNVLNEDYVEETAEAGAEEVWEPRDEVERVMGPRPDWLKWEVLRALNDFPEAKAAVIAAIEAGMNEDERQQTQKPNT